MRTYGITLLFGGLMTTACFFIVPPIVRLCSIDFNKSIIQNNLTFGNLFTLSLSLLIGWSILAVAVLFLRLVR